MKKYLDRPLVKTENLVVQNLEDETLLYNLKTNKALCLNETSALIWEMCDGRSSISQIAEKLGKRLKKPVSVELVWLAVDQLDKENLLNNVEGFQNTFEGLSRREVIRKVGFASIVALPIVSAVVAPSAVNAQSCIATGNFGCTNNNQCCSFNCPNGLPGSPDICCVGGGSLQPGNLACDDTQAGANSRCCSDSASRGSAADDVFCDGVVPGAGLLGWRCDPFP